jgi:hypothetical protein
LGDFFASMNKGAEMKQMSKATIVRECSFGISKA